jgi:hypothetical protein
VAKISGVFAGLGAIPDRSRNCHRVEGRSDNLGRARTFRVVVSFPFEKLRVRQDDAKLIIEAVQECAKIAVIWGIRAIFGHKRAVRDRKRSTAGCAATNKTTSSWRWAWSLRPEAVKRGA